MARPLLEIRDLSVHYGKIEAVKGVSLSVDEGSIVCIIGGNGAGKTTILRTISGLERATRGVISFDGQRIDALPTHEIVKMGISQVPAGRRIFPEMSVIDNLRMGAYLRRDRTGTQQDLHRIFQHFPRLAERRSQLAGRMSGGEQQMLAIARALMNRPRLLLLDEPTTGLAPLMVKEIARITRGISETQDDPVSVVLVEQNSQVALRISHRGYVLETGRIVLDGDSSALLHDDHVREAYIGLG
jgi:branched-chain amino acid transport system ATP-binding protein